MSIRAGIGRFVGRLRRDDDHYGLGLRPGNPHPRAYVGPPQDYDLIAGIQFSLLLATYIDGDTTTQGSGWLYPGCVTCTCDDMLGLITDSGLTARRLDWMHPRLTDLADRLRQPLADNN